MPSPSKADFLREVLSRVKFRRDRAGIKTELECHISDKIDYYVEQGYDSEKAEQLTIGDMGDPTQIGIELNKQHNPLLGWMWQLTNALVTLLLLLDVIIIGPGLLSNVFNRDPMSIIPDSNILYKVDVDETVRLDDEVIHFTGVVYDRDKTLHIFYEHYDTRLWGTGWSFGSIGSISDNLGNTYFEGSLGSSGSGWKSKGDRTVEDFSSEATTLAITYDGYNRKYEVKIALPVGGIHE